MQQSVATRFRWERFIRYHHLLMALGEPRSSAMEAYRSGTRPKTSGTPSRTFGSQSAQKSADPNSPSLRAVMRPAHGRKNSYLGSQDDCRRRARTEGRVAGPAATAVYFFLVEAGFVWARSLPATLLTDFGVLGLLRSFEALEASLGLVIARVSSVEWNKCSPIVASSEAGCKRTLAIDR